MTEWHTGQKKICPRPSISGVKKNLLYDMCLQNCILRGYREIITRNQTNREMYVQVKGVRLKNTELISIPQRSNGEGGYVFVQSVIPLFWNFNFWILNFTTLIVHINLPSDKTFPWVTTFLTCEPSPGVWTTFFKPC